MFFLPFVIRWNPLAHALSHLLSIIISLLHLPTLKGPAEYSGILASFHPALFILARYHFMIFLSFVMLESLRSCPLTFGKHHQLTIQSTHFHSSQIIMHWNQCFVPFFFLLRFCSISRTLCYMYFFPSSFICHVFTLPPFFFHVPLTSCAYQQTHYFKVLTFPIDSFFADQDHYAQPLCYFFPSSCIHTANQPFLFHDIFFTSAKCHYSLLTTIYQR